MQFARFVFGGRIINGLEEKGTLLGLDGTQYDKQTVRWLPPVMPSKIVGLALNYGDHADELGLKTAEDPILFLKPPSSLLGNEGDIVYPQGTQYMHYEGELAVVMGKAARKVEKQKAMEYVRGFTIANDVTVRDFVTNMFRPPVKAKGFDTFCPLGPFVTTMDEVQDCGKLEVTTRVNGEVRQQGNTKNLLHSVPELIEYITHFMTLEADDIILTGTPKGISPMVPGDRVEISIEKLGTLSNRVIAESSK